jgi:hypothetical protein
LRSGAGARWPSTTAGAIAAAEGPDPNYSYCDREFTGVISGSSPSSSRGQHVSDIAVRVYRSERRVTRRYLRVPESSRSSTLRGRGNGRTLGSNAESKVELASPRYWLPNRRNLEPGAEARPSTIARESTCNGNASR